MFPAILALTYITPILDGAASAAFTWRRRAGVLFSYGEHELRWQRDFPYVGVQKASPPPITSSSFGLGTEGDLDDLKGFPFATRNGAVAAMELGQNGWPLDGGRLRLSLEDQPDKGILNDDGPVAQAVYEQKDLAGVGDITAKVRSDGDWEGSLVRNIDGHGTLRGGLDSRLGWNVDLAQEYAPIAGISPSATYGATQDGVRLRMGVDKRSAGPLGSHIDSSYTASNPAGLYSLEDVTHDAKVTATSSSGAHALQARGAYDTRFRSIPLRGSLGYVGRGQISGEMGSVGASVDYDRYRLKLAREGRLPVEIAAGVGRIAKPGLSQSDPSSGTGRPAELQLNVGKVSVGAIRDFSGPPRVRLGFRAGDDANGIRDGDIFGEPL